ncbi:MAG: amidohydrolase family protein [Firmicutes bacterium]|nr:amidohydrolase family protein [Bacillota bacterium]
MEQLFYNGKIFTSQEERPYAEAMLVRDGRIVRTGSMEDFTQRLEQTDGIDLEGRTVIPGFVDAHMHPVMLAEYSRQIACLPPKINSIRELTEEIGRQREQTPEGGWIRGWGYDEGKYEERRGPNRYDLDRGAPDRPVFLVRSCEHIRCVNSRALEIAGITRDTPDPPGGSIDRDERGEPTGILRESARDLVLPFMPEQTEEELVSALVDLGQLLLSQGIVAVADMGNLHPGGNYELFRKAAQRGMQQRVSLYYMWDYFKDDPDFALTEELMDPQRQIRIAGLKLIGDGSISGRTAWLQEPYLNTEDFGMPVYADEDLESAIRFADRCGCQISVHAMGGRAIDRIVDRAVREQAAASWRGSDFGAAAKGHAAPRWRVEHVTEPSEHAMKLAAERGIAFVSQPIFEYCEIETYRANMDGERLKRLYPYHTMLARGIDLSFSTDAPATSWAVPSDPFSNLKSAVSRRAYDGTDIGQDEKVDIETAIRLYTAHAARVCGFGGLGQLAPGYSADFAVLSEDIFTMDPDRLDQAQVEETYIRGRRVYRR